MDNNFEKEVERATQELSSGEQSVELTPEMQDQFRQVEQLARMDPTFANSQEYKDLMSSMSKANSQATDEEDEDEDEDYDEEEEDDEDELPTDDIFGILKSPKKGKEIKINFEPPKEMIDLISSKFGVNDASKFFTSVDTWRSQAQEGVEVKKEYEALTNDLQAMPQDIRMMVQMWANGEDYTQAFNQNERLDFSGDFKGQNPESLVQHYFGEQYEELTESLEDGAISESEFEDRIKLLAGSTKRLFTEDKQALDKEREDYVTRQKTEFQNMKKTAILSVENLSKAYPNFSKPEIAKIRGLLVEGKVDNLFMNADGTYNENAAEFVAFAMYGKKMLESVKKIAERQGESVANQKIVDSSPKALRKQKSAGPNGGLNKEALGHLNGVFRPDPYA